MPTLETPQRKTYYTPEEYLAWERQAESRSEYWDGEIIAMSGATRRHNVIAATLGAMLINCLEETECEVYITDMKVWMPSARVYAYPDIAVVCGMPEFQDDTEDILLNPLLLIEVLSESTENYDRTRKFDRYKRIDSLREYILVEQEEPRLTAYRREPGNLWPATEVEGLNAILPLNSVNYSLSLARIYRQIVFP